MEYLHSALLGIIQGLTEFLPVSSSGHLKIFGILFDFQESSLLYDVILHFGSLLAILLAYKDKLIKHTSTILSDRKVQKYWILVIAGIIPAIIAGLLFEDIIETAFDHIGIVGIMLLITGLILFLTKFAPAPGKELLLGSALIIGFVQIFALIPGVSRSGITIAAALMLGLRKEDAVDFSFMMAIPLIAGATGYKLLKSYEMVNSENISLYATGFVLSFIFSYLAIRILLRLVRTGRFHQFARYCIPVGVVSILYGLIYG